MTLNLTLPTRFAIHQSADYRLYDVAAAKIVDVPSTKQVSVNYPDWQGTLTYSGTWQR